MIVVGGKKPSDRSNRDNEDQTRGGKEILQTSGDLGKTLYERIRRDVENRILMEQGNKLSERNSPTQGGKGFSFDRGEGFSCKGDERNKYQVGKKKETALTLKDTDVQPLIKRSEERNQGGMGGL